LRIVIDTNVLISAFIGRGSSHKVLEYSIRNHQLVGSQIILSELREKLVGKFKFTPETADEAIDLLQLRIEIVEPKPLPTPICRDTDDDNVLATALSGNCELIIAGDKDLLVLERVNNVNIVSPAAFAATEGID